jgi:hypothetical protein
MSKKFTTPFEYDYIFKGPDQKEHTLRFVGEYTSEWIDGQFRETSNATDIMLDGAPVGELIMHIVVEFDDLHFANHINDLLAEHCRKLYVEDDDYDDWRQKQEK